MSAGLDFAVPLFVPGNRPERFAGERRFRSMFQSMIRSHGHTPSFRGAASAASQEPMNTVLPEERPADGVFHPSSSGFMGSGLAADAAPRNDDACPSQISTL